MPLIQYAQFEPIAIETTRITEASDTRITEAGDTRITNDISSNAASSSLVAEATLIPYGKTLKDIKPPDPPSPPPPPPPTPKGKPIKLIPISSELWDSNQSAAKLGDAIKNLKQRGYSDKEIQKAIVPSKLVSQPG